MQLNINRTVSFLDSNQSIIMVKENQLVTLYSAFLLRPKAYELVGKDHQARKASEERTVKLIFDLLSHNTNLDISLYRFYVPAVLYKKSKKHKGSKHKDFSSVLFDAGKDRKQVYIIFFLVKVWKQFDLLDSFMSKKELIQEFNRLLKDELKERFYAIGKVARVLSFLLKELIVNGSISPSRFADEKDALFHDLTEQYGFIISESSLDTFLKFGPSVDLRRVDFFKSNGLEHLSSSLVLGRTEAGAFIGFPSALHSPILLAGSKKTREIIALKILESAEHFIVLDPRKNLELKERLRSTFRTLKLGDNFRFNILFPQFSSTRFGKNFSGYILDFLDLLRLTVDARTETISSLKDIIEFYQDDYAEVSDELVSSLSRQIVTVNNLYSMLINEPGGLIITDHQLSSVRALLSELRDEAIANDTVVLGINDVSAILDENVVVDFYSQSFKIQKIFLFAFLLQLSMLLEETKKETVVFIDDAELFFGSQRNNEVLVQLLKRLQNQGAKLVFSTPFPSQLAPEFFDLFQNRVIGSLKTAKCVRLIGNSHNIPIADQELLLRLPKDTFILIREDLPDKPILLSHLKEDLKRYLEEPFNLSKRADNTKIEPSYKLEELDLSKLLDLKPIFFAILSKLETKQQRGINTESITRLFPSFPEHKVKEALVFLENFGYLYIESVKEKGMGETWLRITPKGSLFLRRLKEEKMEMKLTKEQQILSVSNAKEKVVDEDKREQEVVEAESEDTEGSSQVLSSHEELISTIEDARTEVRSLRDSTLDIKDKLIALTELIEDNLISDDFREAIDISKIERFYSSLKELIKDVDNSNIPKKVENKIFHKFLLLLDDLQLKLTFGPESENNNDEDFVMKVLETELQSDKWSDFDRNISVEDKTETTSEELTEIERLLSSEFPEEVLKGLELSAALSKEQFIAYAKRAIASLLQIKMRFYPNLEPEDYLSEVKFFFLKEGLPEPFMHSLQQLWEYENLVDEDQGRETHREIIESIRKENDSFEFELDEKKDDLISRLIESIRRLRNDGNNVI